MVNCTMKQVQQFIRVTEKCLLKDADGLNSPVLDTFSSREGVEILRNMFGPPKKLNLYETAIAGQVSSSIEASSEM